jgi:hypothetical protein
MIARTIDGRMLCASKWAYAIAQPGPVSAIEPYASGCGLQGAVTGFATGSSRIDAAFVGTGQDGVVLAFRGTLPPDSPDRKQTLSDWLHDVEVELVEGYKLPGLVHHGFLGALDALWPAVYGEFVKQMAASPVKRLCITGHSKGGSMAHLAAARFALSSLMHGSDITVRTFEGAHPGDASFADGYQRLVSDVIRYEFQDDLVPHVPPSIMFRHLFAAEPLFAPLMAADDRVDYAPAGTLKFIDWDGKIQDASTLLSTERLFHLSKLVVTGATGGFAKIVGDHSIDSASGIMWAVCPELAVGSPPWRAPVTQANP